ncbi:MFS transporter [Candidatus Uhrbacteria bacterium]|nr:MFS transporter [Candidatus Uhrbacteria bacterium]
MHHVDFKKLIASGVAKERTLFPSHLPRELKELYLTMTMLNFALAAGMLFEPIYLYQVGFSISQIMLYFFAVYVLYFFAMPLGAKFVKWRGFEHGIILGSVFLVVYLILLLQIPRSPIFVGLAILALVLQKMFFWPGYHADFAFFSKAGERGREVGIVAILDSLSYVIGPIAGGLLIATFGFTGLFTVMCVIILLSTIPLLTTKEVFQPSSLGYREPYIALAARENRHHLFGCMGFGEELVALTIWPIFIFLTFENFVTTGAAITISTLITSLTILYVGKLTDISDRKRVLRLTTLFLSISWLLRVFVRGAGGVVFADFFSRTTKYAFALPFFSGLYAHASKTSVVRTVIFFEMSLTVGKIIVAAFLAVWFHYVPDAWSGAFVLAALFSLLYFFLSHAAKPAPIGSTP